MPVRRLLPALVALLVFWCAPASAGAAAYVPPAGTTWTGVTGGETIDAFEALTGKHPAVWQHWIAVNSPFQGAIDRSAAASSRLMLHVSTASGQDLPGWFTPGEIARGFGDEFLVRLADALAATGAPVYLRLMGEMNNCHNAYAAYDCGGRWRGADHSPTAFKLAWRRIHVILRGGAGTAIDARLTRLGLPPLQADGAVFPRPRVAFVWTPMTAGSPNIAGLRPEVYWPGSRWVDWVGTSFYSRFPNFAGLGRFYSAFAVGRRKPFALAEWAMWGADDARFARALFRWIAVRPRVRMVQYNQGSEPGSEFALERHPAAAAVIRAALAGA
ncbi:MAG TPA: hypothetical protein VN213_20420 [Solirubrobacteraceae bacterium]|nr:hypothetical protein [Solirubrobacteraceae bacterium]